MKKTNQPLLADDMTVYIENLKEATDKLLDKIRFSKVTGYAINI